MIFNTCIDEEIDLEAVKVAKVIFIPKMVTLPIHLVIDPFLCSHILILLQVLQTFYQKNNVLCQTQFDF